jgi:hypothetical protein
MSPTEHFVVGALLWVGAEAVAITLTGRSITRSAGDLVAGALVAGSVAWVAFEGRMPEVQARPQTQLVAEVGGCKVYRVDVGPSRDFHFADCNQPPPARTASAPL